MRMSMQWIKELTTSNFNYFDLAVQTIFNSRTAIGILRVRFLLASVFKALFVSFSYPNWFLDKFQGVGDLSAS